MRVYLDNCCYNRPYDDQSQAKVYLETLAKLEIQRRIRSGKLELAASYILELENSANPYKRKRIDIQSFIDKNTTVFVTESKEKEVRELASKIMKIGVKLMDACHIACAILSGCDALLSTDKRLLKYQTDAVRIMNPVVYLMEQEDEK